MKSISHTTQKKIWDEEHKKPNVLKQMDSSLPSSGVTRFWDWLRNKKNHKKLKGIEMGCGKGRNVIGLAKLGIEMTGIDFSPAAIEVAKKRAKEFNVESSTQFLVHDATIPWLFDSNSFDLAIDCFATTDIETPKGRK